MAGNSSRTSTFTLDAKNNVSRPFAEVAASVDALSAKLTLQAEAATKAEIKSGELYTTIDKLTKAQQALASQNALAENFKNQSEAVEAASQKLQQAQEKLESFRAKQGTAAAAVKGFARDMKSAENGVLNAQKAFDRATGRLTTLQQKLEAVGADTKNLESFQLGLAETFERTSESLAVAREAYENYDENVRKHNATLKAASDAAKQAEAFDRAYAAAVEEDAERIDNAYKQAVAINKQRDAAARETFEQQMATLDAEVQAVLRAEAIREEADAENAARDEAALAKAQKLAAAQAKAEEDKARTIAQFNSNLAAQIEAENQKRYEADYKLAQEINANKDALARESFDREIALLDAEVEAVLSLDRARAEAEAENERRDRAATMEAEKQAKARQKIARDLLYEQVRQNRAQKPAGMNGEGGEEGGEGSEGGGPKGALGLRPYELQELGYRIKDIIDQLGAGSSITRVIAQQGAATASIFMREAGQLVAYLPIIGAGAAAVALLAAAFYRLNESARSLREFNAELMVSVDGAKYSADALVADQRAIQDLGNGFKESGDAIREFMEKGLRPDEFERFAKTATMVSRVYGTAFPEAVKETTAAFTGNYEAITKLDDKYDFLTAAQREQIRNLYEQGRGAEGAAMAFDLYSDKVDKAAKQADGPFAVALRDAKLALDLFLDDFNHWAGVDTLTTKLSSLTGTLQNLEARLKSYRQAASEVDPETGQSRDELKSNIEGQKAARARLEDMRDRAQRTGAPPQIQDNIKAQLAEVKANLRDLQGAYERVQRAAQAQGVASAAAAEKTAKGLGMATEAQRKQIADYLHDLQLEDEAREKNNSKARLDLAYKQAVEAAQAKLGTGTREQDLAAQKAGDIARAAEQERINEQLRRKEEGLQRELAGLVAEGDKSMTDSLQARLDAITERYSATYEKVKDLQARGGGRVPDGKGGSMSLDEFKAQEEANEQLLKQQEEMKFDEEELTKLTQQRDAALKQINDDVKAGNITGLQGYAAAQVEVAKIAPKIKQLADDALRFARNLGSAHAGPTLDAFVDKFNRAIGNDATKGTEAGGPVAKSGQELANTEIERANDIMKTRNDLQEAYGELVTKGIITEQEAETKLKANYAQTDAALQMAIKNAQDLVKALQAAGDTPELDLLAAKLAKIADSSKYVSKSAEEMNKEILKLGESSVNKGLEGITEQLGKVIAGTEKWGTALHGIVQAVGSMVSSFLMGIARILLKQQEEQAELMLLKALGLGTGAGSGVGGFFSSIFGGSSGAAESSGAGATDYLSEAEAAGVSHGGGLVEPVMGTTRLVHPSWFANAPRYHNGGMIGLAPNEQAAVLQHGEEVLTKSDPRNALNGGKGNSIAGQPQINMRHILVMDPDLIPQAMLSARGEETTMSHIKNNLPTLRQLLNVGGRRVGGS
jgi:hypothetical protein